MVKRSVSIDAEVAAGAEQGAAEDDLSFSAWLSDAAHRQLLVREALTYDTGALVAAERGDRIMWSLHRAALRRGLPPAVPAGVLAEGSRGGPQANMSRLLKACEIESKRKLRVALLRVAQAQSRAG